MKILCGFPPGGSADFFARLLADELGKETGKTYVVDNKPGVGGALAAEALKAAAKDGNTILVTPDTVISVYPHTVKQPRYAVPQDILPVALFGTYNVAVTVAADGPYKDFAGLSAAFKSQPAKASYGSPGAGSLPHLFGVGQIKAGKVRVLATSDSKRSPRSPDTPTFAELGYPQLSTIGWSERWARLILAKVHLSPACLECAAPEVSSSAISAWP